MSDIGIDIPFPILLALVGALYWPVTLGVAAAVVLLGTVLPRVWMRVVCFGLTAVLAADCLLAVWLRSD